MATDGTATVSLPSIFDLQKFHPLIEPTAKLLLAVSVLLYSLGLFISNVYFQQFGLVAFSLLRPQYILVGLLWSFLVLLGLIITASLFDGVQALFRGSRSEATQRSASFRRIGWVLFSLGTTLFIGRNVLAQLGVRSTSAFEYFMIVFIIESNCLSLILLGSAISHAVKGAESPRPELGRPVYIVSIFGVVLGVLVGYSMFVFPFLDQSFGGGRLHRIELMVKPEKATALTQLGIELSKDGKLGPVLLISEGTDGFLITTSQATSEARKAYRISRDSVDASRYTK